MLIFLGAVSCGRDKGDRDAVHAGVSAAVGAALLVRIAVVVTAALLGADPDHISIQHGAGEEESRGTCEEWL